MTSLRRHAQKTVGPVILDASGLALISVAAFTISATVGFAVSGLACFALRWRTQG